MLMAQPDHLKSGGYMSLDIHNSYQCNVKHASNPALPLAMFLEKYYLLAYYFCTFVLVPSLTEGRLMLGILDFLLLRTLYCHHLIMRPHPP